MDTKVTSESKKGDIWQDCWYKHTKFEKKVMKKILITAAVVLVGIVAFGQTASQAQNGPIFKLEESNFDFGDIVQGEKVEHVFKFTNTGTEPLIITNIQVTCGCTAPSWPRDPIAPGQKSEVTVAFNTTGKMGGQSKVVTVVSNAVNDENKIMFTANVVQSKDPQ